MSSTHAFNTVIAFVYSILKLSYSSIHCSTITCSTAKEQVSPSWAVIHRGNMDYVTQPYNVSISHARAVGSIEGMAWRIVNQICSDEQPDFMVVFLWSMQAYVVITTACMHDYRIKKQQLPSGIILMTPVRWCSLSHAIICSFYQKFCSYYNSVFFIHVYSTAFILFV